MPRYTVKDSVSGRTVTFEWNDENPPNDEDLQKVFAAARVETPKESPAPPKDTSTGGFIDTMAKTEPPIDIREVAKNTPRSFVENVKNLATIPMMALSPKKTAETLGQIGGGIFQKLTGNEIQTPGLDRVNAIIDYEKNRYGGGNIYKTIEQDPVGVAADASALLMGGGGLLRGAGSLAKSGRLAGVGKDVMEIGAMVEPINALTSAAGSAFGKMVPESKLSGMYEKALKPPTTMKSATRQKLNRLGRELQLMPTSKGVDQLESIIKQTDDKIASMITEAGQTGAKIPAGRLMRNFGEAFRESQFSGLPKTARNSVKKVFDEWVDKIKGGKTEYTPQEVQKIKQTIYKELKSQYSSANYDTFKTQAIKGVARAAKESLEEILPEIKQLNKNDGDYIELMEVLQRSANRVGNNYTVSLRGSAAIGSGGAMGYAMGGTTGAAAGTAAGLGLAVFEQPLVKAKLANIITKLKKRGVSINPTATAIRLGLIEGGRAINAGVRPSKVTRVGEIKEEDVKRILSGE